MVSRRNFFSIAIMMAVLLFMFQFSQIARESGNNYDENEFAAVKPVSGEGRWSAEAESAEESFRGNSGCHNVLFLGNEEDELGKMVSAWCLYSKRRLEVLQEIGDLVLDEDASWELVLIDSGSIDFGKETEQVVELAGEGIPLVFCNLPEASVLRENGQLANLLGISEVRQERTAVLGLHLFSGFLLGGEAIFEAKRPKEEEFQDLDLLIPWYVTGKGTKTYMVGIMEEDEVKREEFPAVIWRNTYEDNFIFAVNGNYMPGLTGMGILDAMLYEANSYVLYPVVNAQNAATLDFPYLASENEEEMEEIYSRSPRAALRDVFWSGVVSMSANSRCRLTCFISTKYQYTDNAVPLGEDLPFYLQQINEINAEAGRSMKFGEGTTLEAKAKADGDFFASTGSAYQYTAVYFEDVPENIEGLLTAENGLEDVRTLMCMQTGDRMLLSYANDSVTLQGVTNVAEEYTYSMDLQQRSLITALGYSNLLIDMHKLRWPEADEDRWERYSEDVFSNINTFWTRYETFAYTTLTESDGRVRTLLNLDYREESGKDIINLHISGGENDAWFILRLHGKEISGIENGEYEVIENGAYLIHGLSDEVEIRLKKAREVLQYSGAFTS